MSRSAKSKANFCIRLVLLVFGNTMLPLLIKMFCAENLKHRTL